MITTRRIGSRDTLVYDAITPVSPLGNIRNDTNRPTILGQPVDTIDLQTPEQRAEDLVVLSFRTGSLAQKTEWLESIGITGIPNQEVPTRYTTELQKQQRIADYRV